MASYDLNLLRVFDALYATGNVTRAAVRLGLGQPATSAALARLRKLYGDELFVRVPRGIRPTDRARQLAAPIGRLLADADGLLNDATAFDPARIQRVVRLAGSDYTSLVLLPPLHARLSTAAPGVELRVLGLDKAEIGERLRQGALDLAVGVFPKPPPGVVQTPLFRERFVGVARRGHPLLTGRMTAARFAATDQALVTLSDDVRGYVDERLAAVGLERRVALTLPHMLALPAIVAGSDLIALLPLRLAAGLESTRLATFALPFDAPPWTVSLLSRPEARGDRALAFVRSQLLAAGAGAASARSSRARERRE
jgi:DNA-binding transcriptional LysR family regulator